MKKKRTKVVPILRIEEKTSQSGCYSTGSKKKRTELVRIFQDHKKNEPNKSKIFRSDGRTNQISPYFLRSKKERTDLIFVKQKNHEKNECSSFFGTKAKDEPLRPRKRRSFAIARPMHRASLKKYMRFH